MYELIELFATLFGSPDVVDKTIDFSLYFTLHVKADVYEYIFELF